MIVYQMLKPIGPLKPGDMVLGDSTIHWGLVRLATPTTGTMRMSAVGLGRLTWVQDGVAKIASEEDLKPYLPHLTKRIWLLGTKDGLELRRTAWDLKDTNVTVLKARGFVWRKS